MAWLALADEREEHGDEKGAWSARHVAEAFKGIKPDKWGYDVFTYLVMASVENYWSSARRNKVASFGLRAISGNTREPYDRFLLYWHLNISTGRWRQSENNLATDKDFALIAFDGREEALKKGGRVAQIWIHPLDYDELLKKQ